MRQLQEFLRKHPNYWVVVEALHEVRLIDSESFMNFVNWLILDIFELYDERKDTVLRFVPEPAVNLSAHDAEVEVRGRLQLHVADELSSEFWEVLCELNENAASVLGQHLFVDELPHVIPDYIQTLLDLMHVLLHNHLESMSAFWDLLRIFTYLNFPVCLF